MSKFKPKTTTEVFNQDVSDTSLIATDAKLYGTVDLVPNSERIVAKPVDIMTVCADIEQPRRAIPLVVRGDWDGHPEQVVQLLLAWQAAAEESIQQKIKPAKILKGLGEGIDYKDAEGKPLPLPIVAKKFIDLLQLAASIHKDKLINPITISRRKDKLFNMFLIETGERRWLAHHLLNHFVSPKYGKIKATEVERDVWRQAAENNNRDNLNAIQLARQLAILVMDMYKDDTDVHFDAIETLTFAGCDRRFYAQVANGNIWRIKDGFAERIQAHMGLSSRRMVAAYRKLLRYSDDETLNDEIWIKADSESWTEFAIRTYFDGLNAPAEPENNESMFPTGNIADDDSTADSDSQIAVNPDWASAAWVNKLAYSGPVKVFVKAATEQPNIVIVTTEDGQDHEVNVASLREYTEPATPAATAKTTPLQAAKDWTSRAVQTVTGAIALVQKDAFGTLTLKFPDDSTSKLNKEFASLVEMTEWWAAVKRFKTAQNGGDNAGAKATGTATPTASLVTTPPLVVGDDVYLDDSKVIGKIVKIDGDTAHVELSTGVWHYKLSRLTKAEPKASSTITTDIPVSDADPRLIVQAMADIASILELPEQIILDDLAKLNTERLEAIMYDGGFGVLEQLTDGYYKAAKDAVEKIRRYVEVYIDEIVAAGREMTEEE